MYLDPALTTDDRWHVTRMIYGSQTDAFDFHKVQYYSASCASSIFLLTHLFIFICIYLLCSSSSASI